MRQVCPWCDTEIVWDEEIGAEELCPHCLNMIHEYRTLDVTLDESGENEEMTGHSVLPASTERPRNWEQFDKQVKLYMEGQTEEMECEHCREPMVATGEMEMERSRFLPRFPEFGGPPLLQPPFTVTWFLCPYCFATRNKLSPEAQSKVNAILDNHR